MLFNRSLHGWLLILLLTPRRPNSCSKSDSKTNSPKYTTLHLTPPTLLKILALSFTTILPSLNKFHLSPKPVTITFISFTVSGLTSIPQLPVPLLPLSFTPTLTINSPSLNYSISSRSRTLLFVLSLKLLSPAISLPSYALSTGSESMNASNTSSSHLPTKFTIQRPRSTRFSSVVTLARPPTSSTLKITDRSFRYASPCLWNQVNSLYLFINRILVPVPPFPTHLFLHPSHLPLLFHHSAHLQLPLFYFWLKDNMQWFFWLLK